MIPFWSADWLMTKDPGAGAYRLDTDAVCQAYYKWDGQWEAALDEFENAIDDTNFEINWDLVFDVSDEEEETCDPLSIEACKYAAIVAGL